MKSDEDATEIYALLEKAIEQYSVFVLLFGPKAEGTEFENITFFAPTNAALKKFQETQAKVSVFTKEELDIKVAELLLYHVIDGNMLASDIFDQCGNEMEG